MKTVSLAALFLLAGALSTPAARAQHVSKEMAFELLAERGFLKDHAIDSGDLVRQCAEGNVENVKLFLSAGFSPDVRGRLGEEAWYALLAAVDRGHVDVVEVLVEAGADLTVRDQVGRTAFVIATVRGYTDVLGVLLEAKEHRNHKR
jgi:hypothetical protein